MGSSETSSLPRITFWLVPAVGHRHHLQSLIDRLTSRFNTSPFLPHMTIWSCERPQNADLAALLEKLSGHAASVSLKTTGLAGSDLLTKSFYLRLEPSEALLGIVERVRMLTSTWPSAYLFDPHLSLLYHALSKSARQRLIDEISPDLAVVDFDELRVVAIPDKIVTPADLCGWQTLATRPFSRIQV
ncbi:MAG: hypothetical protein KAT93_07610 [Desulfuromonadales bacterium]|nr:hypothetical protein [Desulfuromonadales bacterium]